MSPVVQSRPGSWACKVCGSINSIRVDACRCGRLAGWACTGGLASDATIRASISYGYDGRGAGCEAKPHTGTVPVGLVTNAIKESGPRFLARREWRGEVRAMRRDVQVKRILVNAGARLKNLANNVRSNITELSSKAVRRMVLTARNLPDLPYMITLTFPGEWNKDGEAVKYMLKKFKQWLTRRKVKGFWFLEFQKRGAPHFHLYIDKYVDHLEVSRMWYEIVGSGDVRHLSAGTRVEQLREYHALATYAEKYASKAAQKEVPDDYKNVGRFWGKFGGLQVEERFVVSGPLGSGSVERTGEVSVAPALRVVEKLYTDNRANLRARGVNAKVPTCGYGRRSYTAFNVATSVAACLGRLGMVAPPMGSA